MNDLDKMPEFKSEDEEREFWSKNDSSDFIDWDKTEKATFPELKKETGFSET